MRAWLKEILKICGQSVIFEDLFEKKLKNLGHRAIFENILKMPNEKRTRGPLLSFPSSPLSSSLDLTLSLSLSLTRIHHHPKTQLSPPDSDRNTVGGSGKLSPSWVQRHQDHRNRTTVAGEFYRRSFKISKCNYFLIRPPIEVILVPIDSSRRGEQNPTHGPP